MSEKNAYKNYYNRVLCLIIIVIMSMSAVCLCACTNQDTSGSGNETEDAVRAADPMTEEEMEADDTDGCIEDSEDLLY